jgi:hypothetical protein
VDLLNNEPETCLRRTRHSTALPSVRQNAAMFISVANRDRTADLGPSIRAAAQAMGRRAHAPKPLEDIFTALSLREAKSDAEYLDRLVHLLWHKTGVATVGYYVPRRPGPLGWFTAQARALFWKLLRYQHDRVAYQQNMINTQFTVALEFMHDQFRQELATLRQRVAELEAGRSGQKAGRSEQGTGH